jgi:hypothetical protein
MAATLQPAADLLAMWRSSWTATAAGRSGGICRASRGIAAAWPASAARSKKRPAAPRAAHAVLPVERKLEAAAAGARFPDAPARAVHDRRAVDDHAAEHRGVASSAAAREFPPRRWPKWTRPWLSAANTGTRLCLAINYGGRGEWSTRAADRRRGPPGTLDPAAIDEQTISDGCTPPACPTPTC